MVKELSVFIDELGDFGQYAPHSPFYIVTLVFHDQSVDLSRNIGHLNSKIRDSGLPDTPIHAGPLVRREYEYLSLSLTERKRIFNSLYNFARTVNIKYYTLNVEKKELEEKIDLNVQITKKLSAFLFKHLEVFTQYERIMVYYDFGQMELANILVSVFNTIFQVVEFRKVKPVDYKLFQAADMLCTLELLALKAEKNMLSKSESVFFTSSKNLNKAYLKAIQRKRFI